MVRARPIKQQLKSIFWACYVLFLVFFSLFLFVMSLVFPLVVTILSLLAEFACIGSNIIKLKPYMCYV